MTIKEWQERVYQIADAHGFHRGDHDKVNAFYQTDRVARWLMLIVTEASEAMEALRHSDRKNFEEEMADIVIRVMDTCESLGTDLEAEIEKKSAANEARPLMHGGKRC